MLKICLYSPYIPKHFGGGERYMFDVALSLAKKHRVSVAVTADNLSQLEIEAIRTAYESFLGASLKQIEIIPTPLGSNQSFFSKMAWTKQWDVLYHLTDGSLFFSAAKKNILHIQFPFSFHKSGVVERLKLAQYQVKNTNSSFTKAVIESHWPVVIDLVHHPRIEQGITSLPENKQLGVLKKKQKIILNVGRFFRQLHSKRQDVLVRTFKELIEKSYDYDDWKLVLVGSVEDESYAKEVAHLAKGLPIEIHHQVSRAELLDWYTKASIYWHATGFNVDQTIHPEKVEHFGITTGEAMSFGCAPIVINKGGQPEILGEDLSHLLWESTEECIAITTSLMEDRHKREASQQQALEQISKFSLQIFEQKLATMIS